MKRSPLRRARKNRKRGRANSRPNLNAAFRAAYLAIYDYDEWAFELGITVVDRKMVVVGTGSLNGDLFPATDPNHIWSIGRRPDVEENLIALTRESHLWFHKHLREGRVFSVLAKIRKAARRLEPFDVAALDKAAGKSVLGTIENYSFPDAAMWDWQAEVIERLKKLKGEQ